MRKKQDNAGMVTIEAALLMPILLCIIAALCYFGFYSMDRSKVYGICDEVMIYAASSGAFGQTYGTGDLTAAQYAQQKVYQKRADQKMAQEVKRRIEKELKNKLLCLRIRQILVKAGRQNITLTIRTSSQKEVWKYLGEYSFRMEYRRKTEIGNGAEILRKKAAWKKGKQQEQGEKDERKCNIE